MKIKQRALIIPDSHNPFIDEKAFRLVLDVAETERPDTIVYLGDWHDCYSVSEFGKDPRVNIRMLEDELKPGIANMARLEKASGAKRFAFIQGNHEFRVDRYLAKNAYHIANSLPPVREILQIPDKYEWIPWAQGSVYHLGRLIVTHGNATATHAASAMVNRYGASVLFGHTHRIQEFQRTGWDGVCHRGINVGWLGNAKEAAPYVVDVANWAHGFAIVTVLDDDNFFCQVVHIVNGRCMVNGKLYDRS